jgi:hypothetical protein
MTKDSDVRHIRIEVDPQQHRQIRLASASRSVTMTQFVKDAANAAAEEEVARLAAGDTRAVPKKRRRKRGEHIAEAG